MIKNTLLLLFVCVLSFSALNAQRNCGSMDLLQEQLENDPKRQSKLDAIEKHTKNFIENNNKAVNGIVTIPVVVHVVYNGNTQNISTAQINTQMDVLNEDFRRLNSDADGTWPQADDAEIEFCLATVDPNGNATTGITRTSTTVNGFGTNDAVKFASSGGVDAWPAADYLNVWVCNIGGGILGYAQFPGGNPATDGVVNDYRYFGTTGTATAPFNLGRTMTHEVGHYLNLRHIWGDGGCGVDDFVSDTPTSDASNGGCNTGHVSCGTVDMVQNYMDYSDDACMNLFTTGQKDRMRAVFDTGGARESLLSSGACGNTPPPTCTDGIQNGNETGVDCGGPDCAPCNTNCTTVSISITFDNYPEETTWTITNAGGSIVASGGPYGSQADGSTINLSECLADGCYDFTIFDAYGDGICCSYGNGSYTVTVNGSTVASGGAFGSSETTNFCIGGGPTPTCTDGIQNGNETGVDCGGPDCAPCATCNDGIQNGNETGVDCGGPDCAACPTCNDGVQNGNETGVDCGGPDCAACPTCNDGIQNGNETGVDCGGPDCAPCNTNCTTVSISITFDNYPEETTWTITDDSGSTVASGGPYGSQADGSTINLSECLSDGCYDFNIFDAYGDGICCSYGNGSYTVTVNGSTVASGGAFGSSETTNFCIGGGSTPTCNDGIQNGDETGVDCGGSCAPCSTGCTDVLVDFNNLDSGWQNWNDGGSDCIRSSASTYAYSGTRTIRIRDNTNTSVATSDAFNLSNFDEVTVDFTYVGRGMETGEDFWLQVSTDNGSTFQTVASYASGTDFQNLVREFETVVITGTFGAQTKFRFRCDASANADYVYIDDVEISGCANGSREIIDEDNLSTEEELTQEIGKVKLYPNPVSGILNVEINSNVDQTANIAIMNANGTLVKSMIKELSADQMILTENTTQLAPGVYYLLITQNNQRIVKRFVVVK